MLSIKQLVGIKKLTEKKFLGIVILHKKAKVCTVDFNIAPFAPFAHSFLRMHAYILYIL